MSTRENMKQKNIIYITSSLQSFLHVLSSEFILTMFNQENYTRKKCLWPVLSEMSKGGCRKACNPFFIKRHVHQAGEAGEGTASCKMWGRGWHLN